MERLYSRLLFKSSRASSPRYISSQNRCIRTFNATTFRVAKQSRTQPKPPGKKPLDYRPPTRQPPPTSPPPPPPKTNPFKYRTIPWIVCGGIAFYFSFTTAYAIINISKSSSDTPAPSDPAEQYDVSQTYDKIAPTFDLSVSTNEKRLGILSLRKELASQARGDVLEVSIGTGRNLEYYDWDFNGFNGVGKPGKGYTIKRGRVKSFTAVDKSSEMLEVAHSKFSEMFPGVLGVRWIIADASEKGTIPGPPKSANERSGNKEGGYDTIIQTMGLCSATDPVKLLKELGDVVKVDTGRILLLEHGRGRYEWLNDFLDKNAEGHAKAFGCWWNRDHEKIVKECGLEVVKIERPKWWHGGTTWWIELKKPKQESNLDVLKKNAEAVPRSKGQMLEQRKGANHSAKVPDTKEKSEVISETRASTVTRTIEREEKQEGETPMNATPNSNSKASQIFKWLTYSGKN